MKLKIGKNKMIKNKKILFALIILFSFAIVVGKTQAGILDNVTGWLWGGSDDGAGNSTGVGWISINNTNIAGSTVSYGVNIPDSSCSGAGCNLSGYAWSENIGWISFNAVDLAGCPDGNCLAQRVDNNIVGWARIVGIKTEGANAGGWQGWIKLSGISQDGSPYGIVINNNGTITKGSATSYVWSNELGWIDFSGALTASAALPPPTCSPGETYTYNCFNGDACVCGPVATTNLWKCMKKEVVCGAISLALQGDCTSNGVTSCSDTSCPACAASNGGWKEVSPN